MKDSDSAVSCETIDNLPDRVRVGDGLPDDGEHHTGGAQEALTGPGPGLAPGHLLQQEKQEILLST